MNIAFLTSEYPIGSASGGGIGTSIYNLAQALILKQQKVHILLYGQAKDEVLNVEGIQVHCIKNVKLKGLSWYLTRKKIERYINLLHDSKQIDIVEAADWTGITSFIQPKNCPIVIKLHGSDTYFCHMDQRKVKFINKFHEKRALKKADGHISVSKFVAQKTNKLFNLSHEYKIIHNGIDIERFKPNFKSTSIPIILYLGTIIRKKGVLEIPFIFNKVLEAIPHAKLILVGGDSYDIKTNTLSTWSLMKDLFNDNALANVTFLGKVPYDQVSKIVNDATICIFPSFAEAFPVSWLEAMAMGKPIVASNIGWGSEAVNDGVDGILVHPTDTDKYANSIIEILSNDLFKQNLSTNAVATVQHRFDIKQIAQQNLEYYKYIVG